MKKFSTLCLTLILSCLAIASYAQSPRMVLVEEATQASCPPCATQNPPLQAMLNQNSDKAIFIGYQVWWPGVDAMYEDNTPEVDERIGNYYSEITGAPNIIVQGNSSNQAPSYLTQNVINNIYAQTSEFDLQINGAIENGILTITGSATATAVASGDLRLRLVITEETIHTEDLAFNGTNGETEFHHVFKKFVNGPEGITLSANWAIGDSYQINETFDLASLNIYSFGELEVIAMIQNDANKFIHQAAIDSELEIIVDVNNNIGAIGVEGLPGRVCSGTQTLSPEFELVNNGNEDLTSATITYNVNGGTNQIMNWTGSLTTYQKEIVVLDPISFVAQASNVVNVVVSNPNGATDENEDDNEASSAEVLLAEVGYDSLSVEILTDGYGDEVYWEIRNGSGEIIAWGGNPNVGLTNIGTGNFPPPADPAMYGNNTLYTIPVLLAENDCFVFHITDYYGDGMSLPGAGNPAPYYKVSDGDGVVLVSGGAESFTETLYTFEGAVTVSSVDNLIDLNSVGIYPNPIKGAAFVDFNLISQADAAIIVTNTIGQTVFSKDLGSLGIGKYTEQINMATLADGFYLVQIQLNNEVVTKKITVAK